MNHDPTRYITHLRAVARDHRERMLSFRLGKADEEVALMEAERCEATADAMEEEFLRTVQELNPEIVEFPKMKPVKNRRVSA